MKIYSKLFFIMFFSLMSINMYIYPDLDGTFTGFEEVSPHHIKYFKINSYSAQLPYLQGGITFDYPPVGGLTFFVATPFVTVSLEHLNLAYSEDILASATIVANDVNSVTIRVNILDANSSLNIPVEANTDDFLVTITAIGRAE